MYSYSDESAMEEELSDSDSEGATSSACSQGAKDSGRNRKNSNPISYSDLSYLNSSRQERRRIEGEIIKDRKLGECIKISHKTIDHIL
jgi:hypothetical protein